MRIPREFELEGDEAILRKEGGCLIVEPVRKGRLLALLSTLEPLEILPLESPAHKHYGELPHHLSRQGIPIGPNDLLIAAHVLTADLTLVTANSREFFRVPGLKVENWLATWPHWITGRVDRAM